MGREELVGIKRVEVKGYEMGKRRVIVRVERVEVKGL